MTPILSILIPTVPSRRVEFNSLYDSLLNETPSHLIDYIEVIGLIDNKSMTIGQKRELLYLCARGEYSWQLDDDDRIDDFAIDLILAATHQLPASITFQERCHINGGISKSNHSLKYDDWAEKQDGFDYVRTPFFKSVIKTEIARSVPVPHIRFGEDHEWAKALKPHLKSEVHIDKALYIYQHDSKPENYNERYGFDKD